MNRPLYRAAFCVGLLAIGWVAAGSLRANPLALAMTLLVLAFYLMGALELRRFDAITRGLDQALAELTEPPTDLEHWLARVPAPLRNAVRLRIDGDRAALPGPAMTPYLAGLLVLLGMLGTFLGMVVTLDGTGAALEGASDLQTLRDSLAAPVKGLGLAFGTSVAGVAASAALGLMSALCRRQRLQTAQCLEARIAGPLRAHTDAHRRQESLRLQQHQAEVMPALVDALRASLAQLDAQIRQSNERLLAGHERFHGQAEAAYRELASSVRATLQHSLSDSARDLAATIQPVVAAAIAGMANETAALHDRLAGAAQRQLDATSAGLEGTTRAVADAWATALTRHEHASEALALRLGASIDGLAQTFAQRSAALASHFEQESAARLHALERAHADQQAALSARDERRLAAWTGALTASAASLQHEWQQAGAQTLGLQARICATLEQTAGRITAQTEAQARDTMAAIDRLVQAASEAPRAAAAWVAQLREQLATSLARDNAMLEERGRIAAALGTLLDAVGQAAGEHRAAIDRLAETAAAGLEQAARRTTARAAAESERLQAVAAQLTCAAVDVASLGEAFGAGVELFSRSGDKLMTHLQRVDDTLAKAIARSDDQLAYYVAQAREVIDLSLMSQQQIVEDLRRLALARAEQGSQA